LQIARQSDEKLPKEVLTTSIMNPRKNGGQEHTLRDYNATAINRMLVYNGVDTKIMLFKVMDTNGQRTRPVEITGLQMPK
jgi:hypothetical protein